jgi:nicotinate dehydrogenase subunit A
VTTLEGLGTPQRPHPLQQAFIQEQAAQCGYCINGMIMTAAALLADTPRPTEAQVRAALAGNLCRCGTHMRILRAIRRAARA